MARIRIYLARHLCTAPRPQKEAEALAAAGHAVSVHGVAYDPAFARRDAALADGRRWTWEPVADFTRTAASRRIAWRICRLRHRLAKEWFTLTGRIAAEVWSNANDRLARHALATPADLTIVHAEGGLWFGRQLQQRGARVGIDLEDWFSRDLTPVQRRGRPVVELAALERALLQTSRYRLTTSHSLARALAEAHAVPPPEVIYNTFPAGSPPPAPTVAPALRLHWFSLVLGPDRGLETLFAALPQVSGNWRLLLRGEARAGYREHLLSLLPENLRGRVSFAPTVAAADLQPRLAENDVGLALDLSSIASRNLTITNKLFHYLHAGLAVVATDTAGHREALAAIPEAGALFPAGDADALARLLNRWEGDRPAVLAARRAARAAFERHFCHERQQHRYAELAELALRS